MLTARSQAHVSIPVPTPPYACKLAEQYCADASVSGTGKQYMRQTWSNKLPVHCVALLKPAQDDSSLLNLLAGLRACSACCALHRHPALCDLTTAVDNVNKLPAHRWHNPGTPSSSRLVENLVADQAHVDSICICRCKHNNMMCPLRNRVVTDCQEGDAF